MMLLGYDKCDMFIAPSFDYCSEALVMEFVYSVYINNGLSPWAIYKVKLPWDFHDFLGIQSVVSLQKCIFSSIVCKTVHTCSFFSEMFAVIFIVSFLRGLNIGKQRHQYLHFVYIFCGLSLFPRNQKLISGEQ